MNIPANKSLQAFARELRKHSTLSEVLLWNKLKKRQVYGLDFDRQKIIGNYIVDFYCPALKLVIEIDGSSHDNKIKYDLVRDKYLHNLGLKVIHFADTDIKFNMTMVLDTLHNIISTTPPFGHPFASEGE